MEDGVKGIEKQHRQKQEYQERYLAGEKICPVCGYALPDIPHCDRPGCLVGVIRSCPKCGWEPEIPASNLMVPGPRFGFKLRSI